MKSKQIIIIIILFLVPLLINIKSTSIWVSLNNFVALHGFVTFCHCF